MGTSAADMAGVGVPASPPGPTSERSRVGVIGAASRCVARWGLSKTTVDDIAREAGCSRATVYRAFPGGKDEILGAVIAFEEARFFSSLAADLEEVADLEGALVTAVVDASRFVSASPVLTYLMEHEPEAVLPHLAFDEVGPLLYRCTAFLSPHLERFLDPDDASEVAEWAARVVLSYWLERSDRYDLRREDDTRRMVEHFLIPDAASFRRRSSSGGAARGTCSPSSTRTLTRTPIRSET